MSGLIDVMLKRRSIRKYTGEAIPVDKLDAILKAGLLAPTSRNLKPCEFYVVRDKETLRKLAAAKNHGAGMIEKCDTAIAVFGDGEKADTWVEDCSIALSFMMLAAEEQNIGNCWVQMHFRKDDSGNDAEENVRKILSVPERFRIAGILALGIAAEEPKPHTLENIDTKKIHCV